MNHIWTPEQSRALSQQLSEAVKQQVEGDPELLEITDWMIQVCGLKPTHEHRQVVFLACMVTAEGGKLPSPPATA